MATYTGRDLTDVQSARTAENLSVREAALRRTLAAMQAMSEVGRQSSAERIAQQSAANEAVRLQNAMTLGRDQYGSQERIAGLERESRKEIAGLDRESRMEINKLPFSKEAMEFELAKIRAGVRPDPYMTRDIGQANIESIAMNDLAKSIAESANLTIDREEAELLKDLPGPDWWNKDAKIKDGLTRIITGLDAKLGENRQLLEFVPATNRYKPRVRAIIPIPNGQLGPTAPSRSVGVPFAPNQSIVNPPAYGVPSLQLGGLTPLPTAPVGRVAVPVAPSAVAPEPHVWYSDTELRPRTMPSIPTDLVGATALPTMSGNARQPAVPSNPAQTLIAADLAKLATVGPVAPGTTSTSRASGIVYIFNGSTWQPMPK